MDFYLGRNRAFAQLGQATLNGSDTNVALSAGQGARLYPVTTVSGKKVRAQIIERDPVTKAVLKCEIINITNNVSDSLIIERAVEATRATDGTNTYAATPQTFTSAAYIEEIISVSVIKQVTDQINAVEAAGVATYATKAEVAAGSLVYGASSAGTDTYAVSIPSISAYTLGFSFKFLADVGNINNAYVVVTGSAGVLATLEIVKNHDQSLATGDIEPGQIVEVTVNTVEAKAQMNSQIATVVDLSGYTSRTRQVTLGEDIAAMDSVYMSADDTVKKLAPTAMTSTGVSVATATTSRAALKNQPLSTLGYYLHVTGGDYQTGAPLAVQVRTMNAAETDFSNGSQQIIYNTSNGSRGYDICPIGVDKFILVWQADTAGAAAGIRCVVITISGTTVTMGSITTLETTGALSSVPSAAKVDTDKAILTYRKDSDGDIYSQVITVSGTAISTNTLYLIEASASDIMSSADQLSTNTVALAYYNS